MSRVSKIKWLCYGCGNAGVGLTTIISSLEKQTSFERSIWSLFVALMVINLFLWLLLRSLPPDK